MRLGRLKDALPEMPPSLAHMEQIFSLTLSEVSAESLVTLSPWHHNARCYEHAAGSSCLSYVEWEAKERGVYRALVPPTNDLTFFY